jgi:hypothetical protein
MIETTVVQGNPDEWREFENEDYDPAAEGDDDALGALIAERSTEDPFGVMILAGPMENVSDGLLKRLASQGIPTRVRRADRDEQKVNEKKDKKAKKDKD